MEILIAAGIIMMLLSRNKQNPDEIIEDTVVDTNLNDNTESDDINSDNTKNDDFFENNNTEETVIIEKEYDPTVPVDPTQPEVYNKDYEVGERVEYIVDSISDAQEAKAMLKDAITNYATEIFKIPPRRGTPEFDERTEYTMYLYDVYADLYRKYNQYYIKNLLENDPRFEDFPEVQFWTHQNIRAAYQSDKVGEQTQPGLYRCEDFGVVLILNDSIEFIRFWDPSFLKLPLLKWCYLNLANSGLTFTPQFRNLYISANDQANVMAATLWNIDLWVVTELDVQRLYDKLNND